MQQGQIEVAHGGVPAQRDRHNRPSLVALIGAVAVLGDFALVKLFGEQLKCGALAHIGGALDRDGAFGAFPGLHVAVHVVPQFEMQVVQPRCTQHPHIGVPQPALFVETCLLCLAQPGKRTHAQGSGSRCRLGIGQGSPPLFGGDADVLQVGGHVHSITSTA